MDKDEMVMDYSAILKWLFGERHEVDDKTILTRMNEVYEYTMQDKDRPGAYTDSKSDMDSRQFRAAGLYSFFQGNEQKALTLLAQSLASAPEEGEPEVYESRSSVLFQLGRHQDCVMDVNRALEGLILDEDLKRKLEERKKFVVKIQQKNGRAINDGATDPEELKDADVEWRALREYNPTNPFLPNSSPKIGLAEPEHESVERWESDVRATENIEPGEILSIEECYVMTLRPENCFTHCAHCLMKCDILIPCPTCTKTMYCSRRCRTSAYYSYHRTECRMIKFYDRVGAKRTERKAIQAFLRGTEQGTKLLTLMANLDHLDVFKLSKHCTDVAYETDYVLDILGSYDNLKDKRRIASEIVRALPTAVGAIVALRALSFFPRSNDSPSGQLTKTEEFAVLLLLNNLTMLEYSKFYIFEEVPPSDKQDVRAFRETAIGHYISSVQSHIRPSCNPNTQTVIRNRRRILFATRPIEKGESLFYGYCHTFAVVAKTIRHQKMMKIGLEACQCEACHYNWPTAPELIQQEIRFLTDDAKQKLLDSLGAISRSLTGGRPTQTIFETEILQAIIEHLKLLHDSTYTKPSYDMIMCEEMLVRATKAFYSNFHENDNERLVQFLKATLSSQMRHLMMS